MLQRNINVRANFVVSGDGFQQPPRDLVGIGVEEANPAQRFNTRQLFQQKRQAIFQAKVLAIARGVLADQSDFAYSCKRQPLRFGDYRFKPTRSELATQLGDDAEGAGMIATFCNFDVGRVSGRG